VIPRVPVDFLLYSVCCFSMFIATVPILSSLWSRRLYFDGYNALTSQIFQTEKVWISDTVTKGHYQIFVTFKKKLRSGPFGTMLLNTQCRMYFLMAFSLTMDVRIQYQKSFKSACRSLCAWHLVCNINNGTHTKPLTAGMLRSVF
jgi:hypothetical protein